jgi:hypothetical protein
MCEEGEPQPLFKRHPSGGFTWKGCPRAALTPRVAELLRVFDGCNGHLTYTEQRSAPAVLVEAFRVIGYGRGVRRWVEIEDAKREPMRRDDARVR